MNADRCQREDELLDALARRYIGPELAAHLTECAACAELELVAGALLDDRSHAVAEAPVPTAGTMWWRMQLRHRQEAQSTARRSLLIGQAVTLAITMVLVVAFFGAELATDARHAIAAIDLKTPLMLVLATWAVLAPIAGWVAVKQK
jgi:predicted anti-sigma-YlaC factor YlaD